MPMQRWMVVVVGLLAIQGMAAQGDEIAKLEKAHGKPRWSERQAVQAKVQVTFGGQKMVDAVFTFDTPVGRSRMVRADGALAVFDGKQAWVSPAGAEFPMARFHLLTWPYFIAAPMKLRDPGTKLQKLDRLQYKLTFDAGVGDAPDDWYIISIDPNTHRLALMAYIVTYGKKPGDSPGEPHAVTYEQWQDVQGVLLPTRMRFWNWSQEQGPHGEPIGEALVSDYQFVKPAADTWTKPADAKEDPLPSAGK